MTETNEGGMASEEDFNTKAQQAVDVPEESEQLPGLKNHREIEILSVKQNAEHQQNLRKAKQHLENGMIKKTYFSYWDFAGQSTYYSTHQAFFSPRAVYLLVFDLSKQGDQTLSDNLSFRLGTDKKCTVAESLQFWASSIKTFTSDDNGERAPVILVGTHGDMLDEATAKKRFDEAKQAIEMDTVTCLKVSNSTKCDKDITELRNAIFKVGLGIANESVPARWMELEDAIKKEQQNGKNVIHFYDIKRINTKTVFKVKDEDGLRAFLKHVHCRGQWMYFPGDADDDNMDLIILKPVALAKFLNSLMRSSLVAEQNAVNIDTTNLNGIVDYDFLTTAATILLKGENIDGDIKSLTKVLIRLKIMMKYTNEKTNETVYIIPSLLPLKQLSVSQSPPIERIPKIKIAFHNFLPLGFFHLFMVALVTDVADICISTIENIPQIFGLNATLYWKHQAILVDIRWDRSIIIIDIQNYSNKHALKDIEVGRLIDDIDSVILNTLEVYRQIAVRYTFFIQCPKCTDGVDNYLPLSLLSQNDEEVLCAARHAVTMNDVTNELQFRILPVS